MEDIGLKYKLISRLIDDSFLTLLSNIQKYKTTMLDVFLNEFSL